MPHSEAELQAQLDELDLPAESALPANRRIYCNRDLRLDLVDVIGFDMDYTLAVYHQEALDRLSIEVTVEKLIRRGYPPGLRDMPLELRFPIRGLLIDKKLGNILKTDRYRYPKKAFHGTRLLSSSERRRVYANDRIRAGTPRYHSIDTLYAFCEATLYAAAIDFLDRPDAHINYDRLFDDVRASIDEAHRDGSIKDRIADEPAAYLRRDADLGPTLHRLRSAGKRLFLLTNSESSYTDLVMRYLLGGHSQYSHWARFFDVVITDARKPGFFTNSQKFALTDAPYLPVESLERGRVYQGGSLVEFERLLQVTGDRILYVGDHIFGDVLRAKKTSTWRTLMIIQELSDELVAYKRFSTEIKRMFELEQRRYELIDGVRDGQARLRSIQQRRMDRAPQPGDAERDERRFGLKHDIDVLKAELKQVESEHLELEARVEQEYHPFWGSPLKAESELSSFGEQVERYACLYTDRVTNLLHYSPGHFFRGPRHRMAHEP